MPCLDYEDHINTEHDVSSYQSPPLPNLLPSPISFTSLIFSFPSPLRSYLLSYPLVSSQVKKLQAILKPMMLRRLKDDVEKNLAPKEETIIEVAICLTDVRTR